MPNTPISQFNTALPTDTAFIAGYTTATTGGNAKFGFPSLVTYLVSKLSSVETEIEINDLNVVDTLTASTVSVLSSLTLEGTFTCVGTLTTLAGVVNFVSMKTAEGAVDVTSIDNIICIDKIDSSPTLVNLPDLYSIPMGQQFTIKDSKGDAATNNITVSAGSELIDGASTYVINSNYGFVTVVRSSSKYSIINK